MLDFSSIGAEEGFVCVF